MGTLNGLLIAEIKVNNHDFYWRVLFGVVSGGAFILALIKIFYKVYSVKIIRDTLKNGDTWSQKRLMTFSSFFIATIYAFVPVWIPDFEVKEFVFIGFLGAGGWSLFRTQKPNENINNENEQL
jgi:hypothetical protein